MRLSTPTACVPIESWNPPPRVRRPRHLRLVPPPASAPGPDPKWLESLCQSVVEILAGRRTATSLTRHFSPALLQSLRNQNPMPPLRDGRAISVRSQSLSDDVVEVAAVVACPARSRAVTLRLRRRHGRWRVVAVAVL